MLQRVVSVDRLEGTLSPPGDKSISHRAILLNAIARGPARITNCSTSIDCEATVACIRKLGVLAYHSHSEPSVVTVEGAECVSVSYPEFWEHLETMTKRDVIA